ncbi:type II secretion system F family protein [Stieleria sp. TO1_6]|uniref:type II secretion system F family protein n=1 Tax=Stieleria tagensis TaxID=2956795 RepID=UPI00209AB147|nr:type II secretion system F family protein [Stieleria tagensis]MCO8125398.1 type II secretion system F family protein [Stieleria tagensis]
MTTTTSDVQLDDESLAMLLDEVVAMAAAERPLLSGLAELDDVAMGRVGRAAASVRSGIAQGRSAADSMADLSSQYQTPIRVAMETMAATGSTQPVHEVVRLIRQANQDRRQIRFAVINPILNVVVGSLILFFVMPWILVSLSEAELIKTSLSPTTIEICQSFAVNFSLAAVATVVVVGLFSVVLYWGMTRSHRHWGGYGDQATFCRWLAIQIAPTDQSAVHTIADRPSDQVIDAAARVVGASFADQWRGVIERIQGGTITATALEMPTSTPQPVQDCIIDLLAGKRTNQSIALDLRRLADLYTQKSSQHRNWWFNQFPRWVSWLIMIAIIVLLLRAILTPLLEVVGRVSA